MKYLLTILLTLSAFTIKAQLYIKVLPQAGLTSYERAEAISYELWAISRPPAIRNPNDVTSYMFGWVKHHTKDSSYADTVNTALEVDTAYIVKVHPQNNLTNLIALFPELSQQEREGLAWFISNSQSFPFRAIVPQGVILFTREQMKANGWFPDRDAIIGGTE